MNIPIKQMLLEGGIYTIMEILEARAIDRRRDAIAKGIVPINGSNWNADRKNPNKVNKALDLSDKIKKIDNTITKYGNISPYREYGGTIENGKIVTRAIGDRHSVQGRGGRVTFHKHPNTSHKKYGADFFRNIPISIPSGIPNNISSAGDYDASRIRANQNKNKKHTEYIFSPNTKSNTVSQINTVLKPEDKQLNFNQKTSHFSKDANNYYDLNGNLKNDANGFVNHTPFFSKDNIPNFKLLDSIKSLVDFKNRERKYDRVYQNVNKDKNFNTLNYYEY